MCSKPFPYTDGVPNSQEFAGPLSHPMQIGLAWSKTSLCAALLFLCAYGLWRFHHKSNHVCYKPFSWLPAKMPFYSPRIYLWTCVPIHCGRITHVILKQRKQRDEDVVMCWCGLQQSVNRKLIKLRSYMDWISEKRTFGTQQNPSRKEGFKPPKNVGYKL